MGGKFNEKALLEREPTASKSCYQPPRKEGGGQGLPGYKAAEGGAMMLGAAAAAAAAAGEIPEAEL